MPSSANRNADRIFVRNGRRHYRRTFSRTEVRVGVAALVGIALILSWVVWKGAHPDPTLFMLETDLSQPVSATESAPAADAPRGPVPDGLALAGWTESRISQFDADNLYVKINGREGYYKSFGFQRLYFMSITSDASPGTVVDIELYDQGNAPNAIGAYSGERSPDARPRASATGLSHIDRNALYLTQGAYYLRAIGSDESAPVLDQLEALRDRFGAELPGDVLPWGYAVLVGGLGVDAGVVTSMPENAFSFGFARNVYSAALDDDSEVFVTPAANATDAATLATRYREGFLHYGTADGDYVKDRYLNTWSTARAVGPWVAGVRRAPSVEAAQTHVYRLSAALDGIPLPGDKSEPLAPDAVESPEEAYDPDGY